MQRRSFLKLIGAVVLAPSLPVVARSEWGWFTYRGYKFRKDFNINYDCIQLYTEVKIRGEWYRKFVLLDPDDWKHRDMYCDNMIHAINRTKRRLENKKWDDKNYQKVI